MFGIISLSFKDSPALSYMDSLPHIKLLFLKVTLLNKSSTVFNLHLVSYSVLKTKCVSISISCNLILLQTPALSNSIPPHF